MRIASLSLASGILLWSGIGHATPLKLGEFTCVASIDEVFALQLDQGKFRLNNLTLGEDKSWMAKSAIVLNLSASGSNRSDKNVYLSMEAVGFDNSGSLTFAVNAAPMMSMIAENKTEEVKGDIYAAPGILKKTTKICVRVSGEL